MKELNKMSESELEFQFKSQGVTYLFNYEFIIYKNTYLPYRRYVTQF